MAWLSIMGLALVGVFAWRRLSARRGRAELLATALSPEERAVIAAMVPLTETLPRQLRDGFEGKINLFLHQVEFIGCDGLEVTEEMRLSIAAQACLLIAGSDAWYRHLRTILIYPGAFRSLQQQRDGVVVTEHRSVRTGESWQYGPVVLSWQDSEQGATNERDGRNVVLHEFAHQLDSLSGAADGAPLMARGQKFEDWRRVFVAAYGRHQAQVAAGHRTVIDEYGAVGPEEFLAVAVELFFERPHALKAEEPEVYEQLSALLSLDPDRWG